MIKLTTIKDKLIAITMISCVISLVVAGSAMIIYSWKTHKESAINRLEVLSEVLGNRSRAALVFNDDALITENLQTLQLEPNVMLACLYSASHVQQGKQAEETSLIGEFRQSDEQLTACPQTVDTQNDLDGERIHFDASGNLFVHRDIGIGAETLGHITMYSDSRQITHKLLIDTVIILLVITAGITVAFMLILRLQAFVSRPIYRLSKTAHKISHDMDASIRAEKVSEDETGMLVDAFNDMLDTIENQNQSLNTIKNNYLALYDKNPMMLFTIDMDGNIISVNEYGAAHLGRAAEELVDSSFGDLVYEYDRDKVLSFILSCSTESDHVQRRELRLHDIDGKTIWTRTTTRCITNEDEVMNILIVCEDITEQKKLSEKLSFQASHDALTGLVNRREFENRLNTVLDRAQQVEVEHALFFLDLDQFKVINDTCGHLAGDHLLKKLVTVISPLIRQGDTLARIGGDEFGVLLENCAIQQAAQVAEQIRQKIQEFRFTWEEREHGIGVSIGVIPINKDTSNITIAMSDADAACYIAKESGRNKIHIYEHGDKEVASRHGEMSRVNQIQDALKSDRFLLMAQKIAGITESTREAVHFEILVRMLDDKGNTISPDKFLPTAERFNLSPRIDRWVITHTFAWLSEYSHRLDALDLCSINLSGNTLSDEQFADFLLQQFSRYRIPSHKICFEITETAAISNLDVAQRFFHSFSNDLRCKFSLDDFGTGLSSFAYLKTMPVDFLKIDGQFVRDITNDPIDMAMVRSINEIGQIMGKKTIAEFVESASVLKQLKLIGIDYVQGYHVSRPVPLSELDDLSPPEHAENDK